MSITIHDKNGNRFEFIDDMVIENEHVVVARQSYTSFAIITSTRRFEIGISDPENCRSQVKIFDYDDWGRA